MRIPSLRARRARMGVLALVATLIATGVAVGAPAQDTDGDPVLPRFTNIDPSSIGSSGWKPASIDLNRKVTFILRLADAPVGERQGEAAKQGKELSKAERAKIRSELKQKQDALRSRIAATGGQVVNQYQDAFNGIAVRGTVKDLGALRLLPGVVSVSVARTFKPDNTAGVQYIGANQAWADLGLTGAGTNIAIIDTGVDYLHANFGGPGTEAAFKANNGKVIEPGTFPTAKVTAGYDFVGDAYDAGADDPAALTPAPDPDPLDCNGHGSHVAGTAAGFGVLANGSTYGGPYNGSTYAPDKFRIGPGSAPQAKILAYRVFGCEGSTSEDIMVAAIDRAVADGADVINMSIGSPFGRTDEPSSVAADVASLAGVTMVISAGNSGPNAYITGAPAAATRAISVAAIDASSPTFPAATMALGTGKTITAINANGASIPGGNLPVKVLRTATGGVSLGCDPAEYAGTAGMVVVTVRGTCARVARAVFGQKAGAAAVVMINTTSGLPPFEGKITENPDTGEKVDVTIPFLGVRGVLGPAPTADGDDLVAADGSTVALTATTTPNTGYGFLTSFSSGGPRNVDSAVKPDVAAPGQSVVSTGVGTGNGAATVSGTSMAAPITAGVAALVTQAHPTWTAEQVKAAIMNTAANISSYNVRTAGAGLVQARKAVDTVALATTTGGSGSLSYGYQPLGGAYSETKTVTLTNTSGSPITYNLSATSPAVTVAPASVTVPAGASVPVQATLSLTPAQVAALPGASTFAVGWGAVFTIRGNVIATPTTSGSGVYELRVPFLVVPRGLSNVTAGAKSAYTRSGGTSSTSVQLSNGGIHAGTADLYAWGISDPDDTTAPEDAIDIRAVGVQSLPGELFGGSPDDRALTFAINTYGRWSNASTTEFDVVIDTQNNGKPDYLVVGLDFGAITAGDFNGQLASFVFDAEGNLINAWVADNPMNGSTLLLPTLASDIGLKKGNSTFNYWVNSFSLIPHDDVASDTTASAKFRAFEPPVSSGNFLELAPGATATLPLSVDRGKLAGTPALGWLLVSLDDANGAAQADTIELGTP